VHPLQQTFGFRVARLADDHLGAQHAAKRLRVGGQRWPAGPVLADRPFAIPDQRPWHRGQPLQQPPPAGEQVPRGARGDQQPVHVPGVPGDHRQHRQLLGGAGLPEPDRQLDGREPEIMLGDLPSQIDRAAGRVRRQIQRPQLGHPARQHPDRVLPADPLGDHRGG
jgi:hypothetical protein